MRLGYSPTGGAERYLSRLAGGLARAGVQTALLGDGSWPADAWPHGEQMTLPSGLTLEQAVEQWRQLHPNDVLFSFERLLGVDVFRAGDGVHAAYLDRLAKAEKSPFSWWRRCQRKHQKIINRERKLFGPESEVEVICNSEMVRQEIRERFGFPKKQLHLVHNGYQQEALACKELSQMREEFRRQQGISEEARVILFVGSGWKRKGAALLALAHRQLGRPDVHLVLVGKGKLPRETWPETLHQTGPLADPRGAFCAADLFALPTIYDPFSNACLEASAFGLPVLTTNGNGFSEALAMFPEAGEVVSSTASIADWATCLEQWLEPEQLGLGKKAAEKLAAAFSLDQNVAKSVAVLEQLARARNPS